MADKQSTLLTIIKADNTQFLKSIESSKAAAAGFASSSIKSLALVGAGFVGIAGIVGGILIKSLSSATESMGKISDAAANLGIGADKLQGLQLAANEAGVSSENLNSSLAKMQQTLGSIATGGGKEAAATLKALGVNFNDLIKMNPEQQILAISSAISKLSSQEEKAIASRQIFGKGASVGLLGSDIGKTVQEYKELGAIISNDVVAKFDQLGDTGTRISSLFSSFNTQLAANLVGPAQDFLDLILRTIKEYGGLQAIASSVSTRIAAGFNLIGDSIKTTSGFLQSFSMKLAEIELKRFDKNQPSLPQLGSTNRYTMLGGLANSEINGSYIQSLEATRQRQAILGRINGASGGVGNTDTSGSALVSSIASIGDVSKQTSDQIKKLGDTAQKSANQFETAMKTPKGLTEQIEAILGLSGRGEVATDTDFNELAGSILEDVRNGESVGGARVQSGLATLQSIIDRQSDDTGAMREALQQLKQYVDPGDIAGKQKVEIQIGVEPDAFIKWANTSEGVAIINGQVQKLAAEEARKVNR